MRLGIVMKERDKARLVSATTAVLLPGEAVEYATRVDKSHFVVVTQWRLLLVSRAGTVVHELDGATRDSSAGTG